MNILKASHPFALQLLMTEDLYNPKRDEATTIITPAEPVKLIEELAEPEKTLPSDSSSQTEPSFFEYLGENNKYTLILVDEPAHIALGPKELETLLNILKGKKQELKDVAVVNINKYPSATFRNLKEFFACNSIVFFGINPGKFNIEGIQSNQIVIHEGTKILATYSITEMLSSVDKKRIFWDEMKKL